MDSFDTPKDEASYYRDKYRVAVDLLNETRAELGMSWLLDTERVAIDRTISY
jgi:ribosomal protein S7